MLSIWAETCRYNIERDALQSAAQAAEAKAQAAQGLASLERSRADSNEFIANNESKRTLALEVDGLKMKNMSREKSVECDALRVEIEKLKALNKTSRADVEREFADEVRILQVRIKESDAKSDIYQRRAEDLEVQVRGCSVRAEVFEQKCKAAQVQGQLDSTTARQSLSDVEQRMQAEKTELNSKLMEAILMQKKAEGEAADVVESEQSVLKQLRETNSEMSTLRIMIETLKESNSCMTTELSILRKMPLTSSIQSVCDEAEAEARKELLHVKQHVKQQPVVFEDKENSSPVSRLQTSRTVGSVKTPSRKLMSTSKVPKPLRTAAEHIFKTLRLFSLRSKSIAFGRFVAFRKYCAAVTRANVLVDKLKRLEDTVSDESQPVRKTVKGARDGSGFKLTVHSVTTPQRGAKRLVRTTLTTTPKKR
jgi:hypothetical protein